TPRFIKRIVRRYEAALKSYPFQCPVCLRRVGQFKPLQRALPGLMESWEKHAFDLQLFAQAETLNIWQYACPYCRANDRSRLFAMFLGGLTPSGKLRLLDFAPSKPLQKLIQDMGWIDYRSADLLMPDVDDRIDITDMHI